MQWSVININHNSLEVPPHVVYHAKSVMLWVDIHQLVLVAHFLSPDQSSGTRFQTNWETTLKTVVLGSHWKHCFSVSTSVPSVLQVYLYTTMRYVNRRFTYLLTSCGCESVDVRVCSKIRLTSSAICWRSVCARSALYTGSTFQLRL